MPVRAGEHSGWLGTGSLGSVAPSILMMKVISRKFLFFGGGFTNLNIKEDLKKTLTLEDTKKKNGAE